MYDIRGGRGGRFDSEKKDRCGNIVCTYLCFLPIAILTVQCINSHSLACIVVHPLAQRE